jgi:aerobic-type carbon monoxide dehydrogenase small subunit (CoxS/CutS family)
MKNSSLSLRGDFVVNGKGVETFFRSADTLLTLLRREGYTEVKEGCREGQCGSCVVLLAGRLVNSCQVLAASAAGKAITTVKGIGSLHDPHPIQTAFVEAGAVQCGFCTPGMVLAAYALLSRIPDPGEKEIRRALDGNLCRCTGYVKIVEAVRLAARRMRAHE